MPKTMNKNATKEPKTKVVAETKKIEKVEEAVIDETTEEIVEYVEKVEPRKFKDDDLIPCRSVTNGKFVYTGKATKTCYRFMNYGDTEYIAYKDLRLAVNNVNANSCCFSPKIIIEDNDFIEAFPRLKQFYETMYTTNDYMEILRLPYDQMTNAIMQMPEGARSTIKGLVSTMIRNGSLDSVTKIQKLDEIFGTNLLLTLANE